MSTSKPAGQSFFDRIPSNSSASAAECKALYDEWAATYDQDLLDPSHDYVGPANAAKAILNNRPHLDGSIVLDAGCGTGLSGIAVQSAAAPGNVVIDGIDISTGMLAVAARTSVYRSLEAADLSRALAMADGTYDVVVCVGTLTGGHVGPVPALKEFVRVVRSGGLVVATVKESVWASDGYEAEVKRLEREGLVEVKSTAAVPYRQGQGVNAVMLVLRRT